MDTLTQNLHKYYNLLRSLHTAVSIGCYMPIEFEKLRALYGVITLNSNWESFDPWQKEIVESRYQAYEKLFASIPISGMYVVSANGAMKISQ